MITSSQAYQLDVATNRLSDPLTKRPGDTVVVVLPTVTGTAASNFTYNTTQTVASGQSSQPLVVRAVNANGVPLSGVPVTFTTSTSGVSLPNASTTTNAQGYAFVTVGVPSSMTSGSIPVSASVTGASGGQFTINIGNPNLPGIGGTSGNPFQRTGLQITAGQGQAIPASFSTGNAGYESLTVRLTDAGGAAVSGATIRWTVNGAGGTVSAQESVTDAAGQSSVNFSAFSFLPPLTPTVVSTVTATAPTGQSVDFFVTTVRGDPLSPGGGFGVVPITVQYVNTTREITLRAGEVLPNAIQAYVTSTNPQSQVAVPSIAMRIINPNSDPAAGPYVECRDVYALSNAQGLISCDLIAGQAVGDTTVIAAVGPYRENFVIHVTQGAPGSIRILQGNNQTGNQSQVLGQPLVIEVRDAAGSPLSNVAVTWFAQLGTFTAQQNTTDFNGRASATLRLPSDRTGAITVSARTGNNMEATFNITVLPAGSGGTGSGSLVAQAGGNQSAAAGQAFGQQLTVRLTDANGSPVQGQIVDFRVTSGSATVNPASGTTNAQGEASTSATAGSTAGAVVVTATSGALVTTFNLTVSGGGSGPGPGTGPQFTANDILNAAGFQPGVSPGSLAYIRVRGIAPNLRGTSRGSSIVGPLPMRLENVEVLFNDIAAPIFAVANLGGEESVVVQVPYEVNAGNVNVTVRSSGGSTTVQNVPVSAVKPGVFTFQDAGGQTFAVATRPDGSYVTSSNPARRGEEIRIYVTGVGQTISASGTNRAGIPGQTVASQVIAGLNNAGVRVRSAEAMEGVIGVSVITMEVPLETQAGPNQPLGFAVTGPDGQFVFANGTSVPIQ
jgi:uncharacterized protein (TIGR03437 family)